MRTILFTGKGGVGKTTLSAATALRCAQLGYRTLVISTDTAHSLADALGMPLTNDPQPVSGTSLYATELDTAEELERYWGSIRRRIASSLEGQGVDGPIAGELAVFPGLDELVSLIRLFRYQEQGHYEVIIIDSAPTGASMRLLGAPDLQQWYVRHLAGLSSGAARLFLPSLQRALKLPWSEPQIQQQITSLFDQVTQLRDVLTDREQTSVRLVLNPDQLSVQETQRAFTYMSLFGLSVDSLYVNRILPDAVQDPFFEHWKADQAGYIDSVEAVFAPLPTFHIALRRREVIGVEALTSLAEETYGDVDPSRPLSVEQPLRFERRDGRYILILRLAAVEAGTVDLTKDADQLLIRLGRFRRTLSLPQVLASLEPEWASIEGQELHVAFREPSAR
ncbi:MAG: TRC40/GET3/ArsA family transport-energizing ATPase [Chloroflexi bacterium]|nr:TRC40/GET3/ArsA family transport-energizing ATPase [Chloroflexota bacterium]